MERVILTVLLINAVLLIGVVLLQRSEGGGLGMGTGGVMTGRGAATALAKLTWVFGLLFMICSLALTIVAAQNAAGVSVMDRLGGTSSSRPAPAELPAPTGDLLPPPSATEGSTDGDTPAAPPPAN